MKTVRSSKAQKLGSQRWMFPALAVLMLAAVLLVWSFMSREIRVDLDAPTYQYYLNQRVDHGENAVVMSGEYHVVFEEEGERSDGDVTPIYYQEQMRMVLPEAVSWSDPVGGLEWRIPALSVLYTDENGLLWCESSGKQILLEGGILSDCKGTYVFLDAVTLTLNGTQMELTPFSFYSTAAGVIRVYDYESEALTQIDQLFYNTTVVADRGYHVDLTAGIYTLPSGTTRLMVATPSVLTEITKR